MKITELFIDRSCSMGDEIDYVVSKLGLKPTFVDDPGTVYEYVNDSDDPVKKAKSCLFITRNKGAVLKECPGTSHYTCCDYQILHTGTFCTMDCSYCILQAYFHPPVLQYFAGLGLLEHHLENAFDSNKIMRIGTGEYTDSLIWEKISLQPRFLVEKFADQASCILELKTKTVNVDSLLDLDHRQKTILAWSLNTPEVIKSEERGTASLVSRLETAQKAQAKGYKLAFHFDPVVIYEGCEDDYRQVIQRLFHYVDSRNIVWISIGSFRFMPRLKQVIEKRFRNSVICYGEFILGLDNKMRYFKPLRINLYKQIITAIADHDPDLFVYYCMEDEEVWHKTRGFFPGRTGELGNMLDKSAQVHCGLDPSFL